MNIKWKNVFTIARKDWIEAFQNKSVVAPMLIVPFIFIVLMPLSVILLPNLVPGTQQALLQDPDLAVFFEKLPPQLSMFTTGLDAMQTGIVMLVGIMFAPFFLILPVMFSTTIAAESFAGERERKTIEALLYTAASDTELFLGKVMASAIPSLGITWASFIVYILVVNLSSYLTMQWVWFPLTPWYALIFWVSPALALLGIAFTVLISARNPTFMGAYQTSASLVVLVVALLAGQISGVMYLTVGVSLAIGAVIWVVAGVMTALSIKTFNRQKLLAGD